MSYTIVPRNATHQFMAFQTISDFPTTTTIEASGANFITNGISRGDSADILAGTNAGVYIVLDVLDEDTLEVYPALTAGAGSGLVRIMANDHRLLITDEATVTAALIAAAMPDERLFGMRGRALAAVGGAWVEIFGFLFRDLHFNHTSANTTNWNTLNEIWFLDWQRASATANVDYMWNATTPGSDFAGSKTILTMGNSGSGIHTNNGSVFLNGGVKYSEASNLTTRVYGSAFLGGGATSELLELSDGDDVGEVRQSMANGNMFLGAGQGAGLSSVDGFVFSGSGFGMSIINPVDSLVRCDLVDTLSVTLTDEHQVWEDVRRNSTGGLLIMSGDGPLTFRNSDPTIDLFGIVSGAEPVVRDYTFNPRFVDVNYNDDPQPIQNLVVSIFRELDNRVFGFDNAAFGGTMTLRINGVDVSFGYSISAFITAGNAVVAINAEPGLPTITATRVDPGEAFGPTVVGVHLSDSAGGYPTVEVVSDPESLFVDQPALASPSDVLDDPHLPIEIAGSPFTTDVNGRINTAGVNLASEVHLVTNTAGSIVQNARYRLRVEGPHYSVFDRVFTLRARFDADIPIAWACMGTVGGPE